MSTPIFPYDFYSIMVAMLDAGGAILVGERLLILRKNAGLTQDELAYILKINKHSISSYERDKSEPPDAIKIEIAKYFHVSIDYLLGLTNDPNPHSVTHPVILLPDDFPEWAMRSLNDYTEFLTGKYLSDRREEGSG